MTEPTPETGSTTPPTAPEAVPETGKTEPDWKAEAEKWKALSRKNEERFKALESRDPVKDLLAKLGATPAEPGTDPAKALEARIDAAEKRAAEAELKALRADVAQAKGLTAAQAKRLQGTTRDELEADAEDLLASFPAAAAATTGTPRPDPTQGARGSGAPGMLTVDQIRQMAAKGQHAEIEKARVEGRIDYESARKR